MCFVIVSHSGYLFSNLIFMLVFYLYFIHTFLFSTLFHDVLFFFVLYTVFCTFGVLYLLLLFFFFFKHKTAYKMRISDWSSDVCSSDLAAIEALPGRDMERERAVCRGTEGRLEFHALDHERGIVLAHLLPLGGDKPHHDARHRRRHDIVGTGVAGRFVKGDGVDPDQLMDMAAEMDPKPVPVARIGDRKSVV